MKIQKVLKILGYGSIIEGIISSVILFITTIMDEDLGALGIIGTLCFSLQITFFSIMSGFICLAISELFSQKKKPAIRRKWGYLVKICAIFLAIFSVFLLCVTFFLTGESLATIIILWNIITIIAGVILLAIYFTNMLEIY